MSLLTAFACIFFLVSAASAFSEDLIHVVTKGETVYSISRMFSVTADDLMKANNIGDPSKLQVGARLKIPATPDHLENGQEGVATKPTASVSQKLTNYRVVKGDTLFGIAKKNNITLAALLEINKFSSNHKLKAGDVIKVPDNNTQTQTAASVPAVKTAAQVTSSAKVDAGVYSLRWPVTPKEITYMTGQMGVVVEGTLNESIKSLTQGNVISAGPWRKFGRVVVVESQGYFYMYGGCETLTVSVGDKVQPGAEVGKLGKNTVSDKPQLFFMVFRSETPIDPAKAPRAGGRT